MTHNLRLEGLQQFRYQPEYLGFATVDRAPDPKTARGIGEIKVIALVGGQVVRQPIDVLTKGEADILVLLRNAFLISRLDFSEAIGAATILEPALIGLAPRELSQVIFFDGLISIFKCPIALRGGKQDFMGVIQRARQRPDLRIIDELGHALEPRVCPVWNDAAF